MPNVNCQHCGKSYHAKRSTSKFCSSRCRVASHRAPSAKERYDELAQSMWDTIAEMHELSDQNESVEYHTHITLGAVAHYLTGIYNRPKWWLCRMCQTKINRSLPERDNCSCGDGAFWVVLDTSINHIEKE